MFLQERGRLHGILDDFFSSFNGILSSVVLFLFFSPFLIFKDLSGINFGDFDINGIEETIFLFKSSDFSISFGDLNIQFGL